MYSIDIIKSCINLYFKLKNENIIGKQRIDFIKSTFNIHINTLYKWIYKYYKYDTHSFNFSLFKTSFKYNNIKITNDIETFIIKSIDLNNNFNIKKIKKNIYTKFNIKLSKATIYSVLHKNNFTYKKLIVKNIPYDDDKIINLKNDLKNKIDIIDINKLFSYDEMSIYLNDKPYKGWSIKGKICFIKTKNKSIFNKRYSIGMSINIKGKIDFTITEKALKSIKFNKFIKKIIKNDNIIFLDNATIHKNYQFKNEIIKNKWNIIYNIPYHSHLNPIEYIFSLLRKELLNNDIKSLNDIINTIILFKKNLNKKHVNNIFNKCLNEIKLIV